MCESLVIAAERYLVAHNIHIIRLVLNPTSAEDAGVIQFSPVYLVSACTFFYPQSLLSEPSWMLSTKLF